MPRHFWHTSIKTNFQYDFPYNWIPIAVQYTKITAHSGNDTFVSRVQVLFGVLVKHSIKRVTLHIQLSMTLTSWPKIQLLKPRPQICDIAFQWWLHTIEGAMTYVLKFQWRPVTQRNLCETNNNKECTCLRAELAKSHANSSAWRDLFFTPCENLTIQV